MPVVIIMHDTLDKTIPLNRDMWADLTSAYKIPHVFKVDGVQEKGLVQYGPEHTIPDKKVCVMTPAEAATAKIAATNLVNYVHPTDCCYIFGPDNAVRGWHVDFDGPNTEHISITTPGKTELFSFMAATMVLWHRLMMVK